jgi:hypothetical protein
MSVDLHFREGWQGAFLYVKLGRFGLSSFAVYV